MEKYFLMHKNIKVAQFIVKDNAYIGEVVFNSNKDALCHLPISVKDSGDLKGWILERGIPTTRQGIDEELQKLGVKSTTEFMLRNYGLSLSDCYWVRPQSGICRWEDVNLYTNSFKSSYCLDLYRDACDYFTPSSTLRGTLKKKWVIDLKGYRRLLKGNYGNTCRQSICECFATQVHKSQNRVGYTPYSLVNINSGNSVIVGCECPNFTSLNAEFIPAIDVVNIEKKPNDVSYYEFYIDVCRRHGIDVRSFLEYQILTDFVISNSDRHFNNFGVLRSPDTLQWYSYAPIFDSGNSLFYKSSYIPVDKALLKLEVTSFKSKEVELLSYVKNRGIVNTKLLPSADYLYNLLSKDDLVSIEVNERLVKAYLKKIKYLEDFQNGADIWSYNYKG